MDIKRHHMEVPFQLDLAMGKFRNADPVRVSGHNAAVGTTTEDIWSNGGVYPFPTTAETIRVKAGGDISDDSRFVGVLTAAGLPADTDTVTIGAKTYTFQAVLTDVDGNVLRGASPSDALDNLISAITLGAGAGTTYATSTTAHPDSSLVVAAGAGDTMTLAADSALATTDASTNLSFGGAVLALGGGAHTVTITYLDANWRQQEETLSLLGAEASAASSRAVRRVLGAYVDDCGLYGGSNNAIITIENSTANQILATIPAGKGKSQMAIYTVPLGKTAYLTQFTTNSDSSGASDLEMFQRPGADDSTSPVKAKKLVAIAENLTYPYSESLNSFISFPEKTDIWWSGTASADTDPMSVTFELFVLDN